MNEAGSLQLPKTLKRRGLATLMLAVSLTLTACAEKRPPPEAQAIAPDTACVLDGMLLADYPGPKAQIFYEDQDKPDFFCDTIELFTTVLQPEQKRVIRKIYVQNMGKADWHSPKDNWIDAHEAFYVIGSKMMGSMGPTFGSFANETDASDFARLNGGKVVKFNDITPDMAKLNGGMSHDKGM